jgi:hypothetical protein
MFKMTNSTNLVKELSKKKTEPTRFQGKNKIQQKIIILLPSWEPKNPMSEEKHLKLQISHAKHLEIL